MKFLDKVGIHLKRQDYIALDYVPYRTICQMLQFLAHFIFVGQYGRLKGG